MKRKIVENYFSILKYLLIGLRLPVFSKKAPRRMAIHPTGPLDTPEEAEGTAFKIKRSSRISNNLLRGLKALHKDYPCATPYLLYGGTRRYYKGDITILPIQETFLTLPEILA